MTVVRTAVALGCFIALCATAVAQRTTGSIRGTVSDESGAVLPGATVTISSDVIIGGTRTEITNDVGVFRFPSISVGTYSADISMDGFDTVRVESIDVRMNATATVNVTLGLATVTETITVIGESPVLDVTQASVSSSYKNEMLAEIPTGRNMYDLMQASPGISQTYGDSQSDRMAAFGSNQQSNSWNIDGVETSGPETGSSWWAVNPDNIEEVEVLGVGAPAEYGNHLGAVLNVVTKKGGNTFHGGASYFWQTDSLTDTNVVVDGFGFKREKFWNATGQLGGPIWKDKVWFYASGEGKRDASSEPGIDPVLAPTYIPNDSFDIKVTSQLNMSNELTGFFHYSKFDFPDPPVSYSTTSALGSERGTNPAWGASLVSTVNTNFLLELRYAGWWSDDFNVSQTDSLEEPFIDFTPADGGPTTYSGGVWYPWDYVTWRQQFSAKATVYAEEFLSSQHEFKFGVQYSKGSARTNVGVGPTGSYSYSYYGYIYRSYRDPYQYGGISDDLGIFVDDTITVNDRLSLNLGVRFDHNTGGVPDYDRLTVGEPSISPAGLFTPTGEKVPGVPDLINWNLVSPRLGFAFQPTGDGRSVIKGSFGIYYDQNVIGNWDFPPPGAPTQTYYWLNPDTGEYEFSYEITAEDQRPNKDMNAPRTYQYAIGYDQQISDSVSVGVQYVHKDTDNLIGWQIEGGVWEPFPFTDPFTGTQYTLLSQVEVPVTYKGNRPGDFPGGENLKYYQDYDGLLLTFRKRYANNWGLNVSYTYSKSFGRIPRMLSESQFNPFYSDREGSDPNNWINSEGNLQGDRPHMFRAQLVYLAPYDIQVSAGLDFSSGQAYSRQITAGGLGQNTATVIMEPLGSYRKPTDRNVNLLIGKRIHVSEQAFFRLEGWVFNLLNSDNEFRFASLRLQNPGETFEPDTWVTPRRLQLRIGFYF